MPNSTLGNAKKAKNDEFYTQIMDIEKEVNHYSDYFKDKTVLCNCNDPPTSDFWRYFHINFTRLGLKKLIATCFVDINLFTIGEAYKMEYTNDGGGGGGTDLSERYARDGDFTTGEKTVLIDNGDFRSRECIRILKEVDIVVTNPPFSLFREYVAQLVEYGKKFLIIGSLNAITYKEIFPLIRDNKIWLGYNNCGTKWFRVPPHYDIATEARIKVENGIKYFSMGSIMWFTNLDHRKRHEDMLFYKRYSADEYPKYDNYDAINVDKIADIPMDYEGVMGVPITFLDKYNPEQFEIVGSNRGVDQDPNGVYGRGSLLDSKETFKRLFIKQWRRGRGL